VTSPDPTDARFARVPASRGHYESFYLKACQPDGGLGAWIRYTTHKRPGAAPTGSLWFTLFDAAADAPLARKATLPAPAAGGGDWIRIGGAAIGEGRAVGALDGVEWDLRFESREPPLFHLPRSWMYRTSLPRTKLVSPAPAAGFHGSLSVDGRTLHWTAGAGWSGTTGAASTPSAGSGCMP
jgi:hypothetical protein